LALIKEGLNIYPNSIIINYICATTLYKLKKYEEADE